jgi:hypothetical protein
MRTIKRREWFLMICFAALLCAAASFAHARPIRQNAAASSSPQESQKTITNESLLVLVPVFVYDPSRMENAPKEELPCARADVISFFKLPPSEPYLPPDCDVTEIHGLSAKDFRLFQDGAEQTILRMDSGSWWTLVRDNLGWHIQSSDAPRGIWDLSELAAAKKVPVINREFQVLAYEPKNDTLGCHHIRVEVDRPNLLVFARNQYCTGQTPSDLLNGTEEGKQLERDSASQKHGKIPLSLQAAAFQTSSPDSRVNVTVEFPWKDLYRKWDTSNWTLYARIAVLGVVRRPDGTIAARFSDLLYPSYWPTFDQGGTKYIAWEKGTSSLSGGIPHQVSGSGANLGSSDSAYGNDTLALTFRNAAGIIKPDTTAINIALDSSDPLWIPTRYKTQLDLPPGDYKLQVVLSDAWSIGRAEIPLTVDAFDGKQLALSSLALCKRLRDAAVASKETTTANFALQYVPLVSKGIEFTPAGGASFSQAEPLYAYFEVYDPLLTQTPVPPVTVNMQVLDAASGQVKAVLAPVNAAPYMQPGSTTLRIARTIPIAQLPKGRYILQVRASDSAATTPWRTTAFTVE